MPTALSDLEGELSAISEHPLFGKVQTIGALRIFMEHHVFAVWDFMSLVKALQAGLAPAHWPWRPQKHPELVRLINEILLAEECDKLPAQLCGLGGHASHFEIYIAAMREVGADTGAIERFLELVNWRGVQLALAGAQVPPPAREFVNDTFYRIRPADPSMREWSGMRSWGDETKIFVLGRGASGRSHKPGSGSSRLWNQSECGLRRGLAGRSEGLSARRVRRG